MQLKRYQERVIREVKLFLDVLAAEQAAGSQYSSLAAWDKSKKLFPLRGDYHPRKNGLEKDLSTFCIKVPTGGGKTLLATQILGLIYQTVLKTRNGSGLVLWVVPSDQIYKDTLKAFRDRRHFYRESLEFALSRRISGAHCRLGGIDSLSQEEKPKCRCFFPGGRYRPACLFPLWPHASGNRCR